MWQQINEKQPLDGELLKRIRKVEQGIKGDFDVDNDGILNFWGRLHVPQDVDLRKVTLTEAHSSPYVMHLGSGNIPWPLWDLLVTWVEVSCYGFCGWMFGLSKGESWTSIPFKFVETNRNSSMEVGKDYYGFCFGFVVDVKRVGLCKCTQSLSSNK